MSNKNSSNSAESVESATDVTLASVNGSTSSLLKSSPLFGWLFAGSDLLSAKLDQAAGVVSKKIDDTHETIMSMQAKGAEVESELKRTLNPFSLIDSAQKLVTDNPLFNVLAGGQKKQHKAQQLAALNAKVDLLVEQVALLAAKEAAAKIAKASESSTTTAPKRTASSKKQTVAASTASDDNTASPKKPAATRRTATKSTTNKATQSKTASSAGAKTTAKRKAPTTTAKSSTAKRTTTRATKADDSVPATGSKDEGKDAS
jgi:hypothetical protein